MRYASPSVLMCFRCLIFTLLGRVELLFLLCFIASCTGVVVSVIVHCSLCVFLSICPFVCFVFDCVGKLFVEYVCVVIIVVVLDPTSVRGVRLSD